MVCLQGVQYLCEILTCDGTVKTICIMILNWGFMLNIYNAHVIFTLYIKHVIQLYLEEPISKVNRDITFKLTNTTCSWLVIDGEVFLFGWYGCSRLVSQSSSHNDMPMVFNSIVGSSREESGDCSPFVTVETMCP